MVSFTKEMSRYFAPATKGGQVDPGEMSFRCPQSEPIHHTSSGSSFAEPMPLHVREFACGGCGLATDRDVNAARNILRRGIALAGWDFGPSGRPGASESVPEPHVAGLPGQDAERYAAEGLQSCI